MANLVSFLVGGLREELWRSSFIAGLRALWPRAFDSENGGILAAGIAALFFGVGHLPQGWLDSVPDYDCRFSARGDYDPASLGLAERRGARIL